MEQERENLYHIDSLEVLDYIKQSVEILMNMKADEYEMFKRNRQFMDKQRRKDEGNGTINK